MGATPDPDQRRWRWLSWTVNLGPSGARTSSIPLTGLRRPASFVSQALPLVMMVVGLGVAVPAAIWAERPSSEGLGSLGLEAGAALWFAGAVVLSLQGTTTVRRALLVLVAALGGAALIVVALVVGWTGAALALAMEFGVGALAVVVVDVVVLGVIRPRLDTIARHADTASIDVQMARRWPPIAMRVHQARPDDPDDAATR